MSSDLVRIGLKGPRYSAAASGFISHKSTWLGAPRLKIIMQALSSWPARPPSAEETQRLEAVFKATPATERRAVVEDLFWALMTSREFLFQH